MNDKDYINAAMRTASNTYRGDYVSLLHFNATLNEAVDALKSLDVIKKTLFYGKTTNDTRYPVNDHDHLFNLPLWVADNGDGEKQAEYIIHSIIGMATETGELLEALQAVSKDCKEMDKVNLKEELGDLFWYMAMLASAVGFSFEDCKSINIAKLQARYPEKFTEEKAVNRDLETERNILENDLLDSAEN